VTLLLLSDESVIGSVESVGWNWSLCLVLKCCVI